MPYLKVKGFVIREVPVGDADRIVDILTADHGVDHRIGAWRPTNTQRFVDVHSDFLLEQFRNFY